MDIVNWFKTKLTPAQVAERQTDSPRAVSLHREFDGHPSKGLTPARLAQILQDAEQGDMLAQAELFMDMREKDAHLDAEMHKREMAVKKTDWSLQPPRDATATEKKRTKDLEALMRDELDIGAIRMDALDAIGHGYSCIELGWDRTFNGLWYPNQVEHRPPTWFTVHPDDRNTLRLRVMGNGYGEPLQPFGWIPHIHKSRSGYLARSGLFRSLAWPYLFKNYSVRDLAEFLEVYGLPIRIGKYPDGAGDKEKADLMRAVLSIGHHAAGIIPESMQIELAKITGGGSADAFKLMMDWAEATISKAVLGGTLTSSTAANGNRALGEVHNEVRLDIRDDDATQLDQSLSLYLVYPMGTLNGWFADNRHPRFVSDTQEPDDLALYADALPKLVSVGVPIPARYANEKLKIPLPEGDEPVLSLAKSTSAVPPSTAAASLQVNRVIAAVSTADQPDVDPSPVSAMADILAADAEPGVQKMVGQIAALAANTPSLEVLRDDLLNGYGHLDHSDLIKVMEIGFAAADLSGRFDVNEGG